MFQFALVLLQSEDGGGEMSQTLLGAALGGSLLIALVSVYRFIVNMRTTERGMARDRVMRADTDARNARQSQLKAQHEADLWQAYAGTLIFELRSYGKEVPPMPASLKRIIETEREDFKERDADEIMRTFQANLGGSGGGQEGDNQQ